MPAVGPSLFPRSLVLLLSIAAVLPLSLLALTVSSALQMYGIAFDIPQLVYGSDLMERPAWILPGLASVIFAGFAAIAVRRQRMCPRRSLRRFSFYLARARRPGKKGCQGESLPRAELAVRPSVKNSEVDAHGCHLTCDTDASRWLDDLSGREKDLLKQCLAESRLAIRHDGVLIAREQADMMRKKEDFVFP